MPKWIARVEVTVASVDAVEKSMARNTTRSLVTEALKSRGLDVKDVTVMKIKEQE